MDVLLHCVALNLLGIISTSQRYAIDRTDAIAEITLSVGDSDMWPVGVWNITMARRGVRTNAWGYANWAMQLPQKGDNFKKNCSYDFFVLEPRLVGSNASSRRQNVTVQLPRVATPGNTSFCVSFPNGTCMRGWSSAYFEHYVAADVDFGRRPYFTETHGSVVVTLDAQLASSNAPLLITVHIPATPPLLVRGTAIAGRAGAIIPFAFPRSFPNSIDVDAAITIDVWHSGTNNTKNVTISHTRRFIREPPPPPRTSALSMWQVDHERAGLRVDGKPFFATGWFSASFTHVSAGLPPAYYYGRSAATATTTMTTMERNESHDSFLNALGEASMFAEWGKEGVTFVRVGGPYVSGNGNTSNSWTPQRERDALRNFRIIADAAFASGIFLLVNLPIQSWANALSGIPVTIAPKSTSAEWQQWTLGNMSLVMHHPAIAGYYSCDDCCHPGVVEEYGPVQYFALAKIHAIMRAHDRYHLTFGTIACRDMWLWKDTYGGSGLGLDVTMAEAYGGVRFFFSFLNRSGGAYYSYLVVVVWRSTRAEAGVTLISPSLFLSPSSRFASLVLRFCLATLS